MKILEVALEDYVNSGGGLYVLHSANNAFVDWPEYSLMIGLGWRSIEEGFALQVMESGQIKKSPLVKEKRPIMVPEMMK